MSNETKEQKMVRAMHVMDGYQSAANGAGILSNPNEPGTPAFNFFVDGWCAYWSCKEKQVPRGTAIA